MVTGHVRGTQGMKMNNLNRKSVASNMKIYRIDARETTRLLPIGFKKSEDQSLSSSHKSS